LTLFLESDHFIVSSALGRLRPNLIIILIIGLYSAISTIFSNKKTTLNINKIGFYLILYVLVNVISLFFSNFENPLRIIYGIKVLILLFCWLIVYFYINKQFSSFNKGMNFLKYLFWVGLIQVLIGTFQILGDFIRPTGTISTGDADFYGILISAYFSSLLILKILKVQVLGRRLDYIFLFLLLINLYYSFVRSAWIGTIAALLFFSIIVYFISLFTNRSNISISRIIVIFGLMFAFIFGIYSSSVNLQDFAASRINLNDDSMAGIRNNLRLVMMFESWENAKRSLIIGNGPSAFSLQGLLLEIPHRGENAFDPSIITTLLNDTGIIGLITFSIFIFKICSLSFKSFRYDSGNILSKYSIAFTCAMTGLIISYIPTTALWIPYSWVFFSLPSATASLAMYKK